MMFQKIASVKRKWRNASRPFSQQVFPIEALEGRVLLDATVVGAPTVVNVSRMTGPQAEEAIAVNPANANEVVLASNNNSGSLFFGTSNDAGRTWTRRVVATGADGLPSACCDPSLAWDRYGNLFFSYLSSDDSRVEVALSTDAGASFRPLAEFKGNPDRPTIASGQGSVWVAFRQQPLAGRRGSIAGAGAIAYGAKVSGLGQVGRFNKRESISIAPATVAGLAIGPAGQVTVAYQLDAQPGPSTIFTRTDPDGLGPRPFGPANTQVSTIIGLSYPIPAQSVRTIDAEAQLAYDTSADPYTGRLYMAYTDAPDPSAPAATSIYLRFSDDNGATWSPAQKVNDDTDSASHWFPRLAVDPVTGAVGIGWYDSRNDTGPPGPGGTDNVPNDDVQVFGAFGTPTATGVSFSPNLVIQPAFSNASDVKTASGMPDPNQFGDYNGAAFYAGRFYFAWADNSNSTADNPNGALSQPDVYASITTVQVTPAPTRTLIGAFGAGIGRLTVTIPGGARVALSLNRGLGYAFLNGPAIDLRLLATDDRSVLRIATRRGPVSFGTIWVSGNLGTLDARGAMLAGTLPIQGQVGRIELPHSTRHRRQTHVPI